MLRLVVREHERLPVVNSREPGLRALLQREVDALMQLGMRKDVRPFEVGFRSVKFAQYCGVIQAGGVSVEILPKIAGADEFDRGVLLRMLALAGDFPVSRLNGQKLLVQSHSLLPALIRWFCDELFEQCHCALLRVYVREKADLPYIRGRWRPDLDMRRFPGRRDRLNCEFDELTTDNEYNRILKAALRKVRGLCSGQEAVRRDVETLLAWFTDVDDVVATARDVQRLPQNRLVARYSKALMMAEWFLDDKAPDLRTGKGEALSLLFDMNVLFQAVLGRLLRRVLPLDYRLREEGPRYFLARDVDGHQRFQMKPDLCILLNDVVVAIIDAKWKRLNPSAVDGKWGVSQSDMYQLFAYANAYRCQRVALWYPSHEDLPQMSARPTFDYLRSGGQLTNERLLVDWVKLDSTGSGICWLSTVRESVLAALSRAIVLPMAVEPPVPME